MELIIKPTGLCNFSCLFCSAASLKIKHPSRVPDQLKELIKNTNPCGLIITGGEPLMVSPSYYEELLSITNTNIPISFTSNLKDFYLHPDKWEELFKNPRIGIGTSFQYGDERRWDKDTPYTEEMFLKVMTLFKDRIGYTPAFITVISKNNEHLVDEHINLAKKLGTRVRLNQAMKHGKSGSYYPKASIFRIWLDIIDRGLEEYETNVKERREGKCNINTTLLCRSTIRAVYIGSDDKIYYAHCEDVLNGEYSKYYLPIETEPPESKPIPIQFKDLISEQCIYCELINICNACDSNRDQSKEVPNHCEEMLKIKDRIIKAGWKL